MQASFARSALLPIQARLAPPARSVRPTSCSAHKSAQASVRLALLPLSSTLLSAGPALAEEVEEAASEALAAGPGNALALGLVISPILFYAGFSLYRSQIDPRAKFGDAVFAFAAFIILANIISITVFKFRIY
ncbi:hypothetical protein ACK3TF_004000 [Chlorella vulgaris]